MTHRVGRRGRETREPDPANASDGLLPVRPCASPQAGVRSLPRVAEAFRRVCVDIRTREVLGLYGYHRVDPPHRLWIWKDDLAEA